MISQTPRYRDLVARANAARLPQRQGGPWTSRTTPLSDPDPDSDAPDDDAEAWVAQIWPERAASDVEYASVEYLLPSFCVSLGWGGVSGRSVRRTRASTHHAAEGGGLSPALVRALRAAPIPAPPPPPSENTGDTVFEQALPGILCARAHRMHDPAVSRFVSAALEAVRSESALPVPNRLTRDPPPGILGAVGVRKPTSRIRAELLGSRFAPVDDRHALPRGDRSGRLHTLTDTASERRGGSKRVRAQLDRVTDRRAADRGPGAGGPGAGGAGGSPVPP
jgi:hypothetical protein